MNLDNRQDLNSDFIRIARTELSGKVLCNEPLSGWTTYRLGGPADFLVIPGDVQDLSRLRAVLNDFPLPFFLLGGGANVLVHDAGFRGVVIHPGDLSQITFQGNMLRAGAGIQLDSLVRAACKMGLGGLENLSGIPGTLGGALRMNAGAFGVETSDFLVSVDILSAEGKVESITREDVGFSYRSAPGIKNSPILGGEFRLREAPLEALMIAREKILSKRDEKQPWQFPSAGSVFKRPPGRFASQLIEEAGLKGRRCGRAQVSPKHAGFILNLGGASASEVYSLIQIVRQTVYDRFGIQLEMEQELVGFE
jgi:UDP-N-acetylmuramate dehydrogenase